MLVVISPAKRLDWSETPGIEQTTPIFPDETQTLIERSRELTAPELSKLMAISDNLAQLNHERFRTFSQAPSADQTRPAMLAFAGDTYTGLEANTMSDDARRWAQSHLRILSGLYGLLRPLDAIQPYRLEMGSRLKNVRGKDLYAFWGDQISTALNAQASEVGANHLINCASQEYFGAVQPEALDIPVITPVFLEERDGTEKIVSFYAKKARGSMARYIVDNRISDPADLVHFDLGGYRYRADLSQANGPVFSRADAR